MFKAPAASPVLWSVWSHPLRRFLRAGHCHEAGRRQSSWGRVTGWIYSSGTLPEIRRLGRGLSRPLSLRDVVCCLLRRTSLPRPTSGKHTSLDWIAGLGPPQWWPLLLLSWGCRRPQCHEQRVVARHHPQRASVLRAGTLRLIFQMVSLLSLLILWWRRMRSYKIARRAEYWLLFVRVSSGWVTMSYSKLMFSMS